MADLNTCTYLGFKIKNKVKKSGSLRKGAWFVWLTVAKCITFKHSYQNKLFNLQINWCIYKDELYLQS
jgi:hypothetical protein